MIQFLMSRLQASAISWSSFSACRNSRGLPTETARVKAWTCGLQTDLDEEAVAVDQTGESERTGRRSAVGRSPLSIAQTRVGSPHPRPRRHSILCLWRHQSPDLSADPTRRARTVPASHSLYRASILSAARQPG